jgi:transcriptional regulator with XRE-family HTH domain
MLVRVSLKRPLSEFGYLILKFCEQRGLSLNELAKASGLRGTSRIYYAIRIRSEKSRFTPLTEAELHRVSKVLRLDVEGFENLVITAQMEAEHEHEN